MKFTKFGRTGLTVSRLCVGTGTFGTQADEAVAYEILDKAAGAGVNFIDTADILHFDDPETPLDETLEALDAIVRAGKARYIGVSNFLAYRLARASGRAESLHLTRLASVQNRYSLLFRQIEQELLPLAREEGIAVTSFNPLAGGLLSGKYRFDDKPTEGRFSTELGQQFRDLYHDRYWHQRQFESVEQMKALAGEIGEPLPKLAIAWVLANPTITSAILGASRPDQLTDTLGAVDLEVPAELKAQLDEITDQYRCG